MPNKCPEKVQKTRKCGLDPTKTDRKAEYTTRRQEPKDSRNNSESRKGLRIGFATAGGRDGTRYKDIGRHNCTGGRQSGRSILSLSSPPRAF